MLEGHRISRMFTAAGGAIKTSRIPSQSFAADLCSLQAKWHSIKTLHRLAQCLCLVQAKATAHYGKDVGGMWMHRLQDK